ncbi:SDR family NAD(P)-dependent oxidoreductase [Actinomycetospora termitidis]|uniref:SDR family oxidoreductase n=1 Tax=Actinomycetospora termitidis TaxID=3053470 RepID=A0ABT7M3V5_9PSEU|nr:SDR family oxidoreductase [Actinomycetospora sp. Odt1-22]MDL5154442.1 SDR family oxidoreductase [Actinomycetospora sp. Odt1-22]
MPDLQGRVAVVFGAGSSGSAMSNGRAAALTYARAGAAVVAVDRDAGQADLTAELVVEDGGRAIGVRADVTDEGDVIAALATATNAFGPPRIIHNNVGVATPGGLVDLCRSSWDRALAVNVTGVFLTSKHAVPLMIAAGGGAIVNVSSVAAIRHPGYDYPGYMAAKAAVDQLTVSIALTYAADGIRANAVLPGLIDTPLVGDQLADDGGAARAERDRRSPTGRSGTPWDVARAALFLASDDAAYVNGVCLPVDGGLTARC